MVEAFTAVLEAEIAGSRASGFGKADPSRNAQLRDCLLSDILPA